MMFYNDGRLLKFKVPIRLLVLVCKVLYASFSFMKQIILQLNIAMGHSMRVDGSLPLTAPVICSVLAVIPCPDYRKTKW